MAIHYKYTRNVATRYNRKMVLFESLYINELIIERNKKATRPDSKHFIIMIKRFMNIEIKSGKKLRICVLANNVVTSLARGTGNTFRRPFPTYLNVCNSQKDSFLRGQTLRSCTAYTGVDSLHIREQPT